MKLLQFPLGSGALRHTAAAVLMPAA